MKRATRSSTMGKMESVAGAFGVAVSAEVGGNSGNLVEWRHDSESSGSRGPWVRSTGGAAAEPCSAT